MKLLRRVMFAFLVLFLTTSLVSADDDPPGRVARLQYIAGSVSIQPRGTEASASPISVTTLSRCNCTREH